MIVNEGSTSRSECQKYDTDTFVVGSPQLQISLVVSTDTNKGAAESERVSRGAEFC